MRFLHLVLPFAITGSLAGCTTSQTQTVQLAAIAPAAAPPAPPPHRVTIPVRNVGAPSGQQQRLDFFASLDNACVPLGRPSVAVIRPPAHGHAEGRQFAYYPGYSANNPHAHCNDRKVPGEALFYTSDPGYAGADPFIVSVLFPSGNRITLAYAMVVQ